MISFMRTFLFLIGTFCILIGTGFIINPAEFGDKLGVHAVDARGLSSLRADFTGFFWVLGGLLAWGAWHRHGQALLIAAGLAGTALTGRVVSLLIDGDYEGAWQPIAVEAAIVLLALWGKCRLAEPELCR